MAKRHLAALYANVPDAEKRSLNFDPRMDLLDTLGNLKVYLVDGEMVREQHQGVEFTDFSHHFIDSFIPQDEIWIDEKHTDLAATIERAETSYKLMKSGTSYEKAREISNRRGDAVKQKVATCPLGDSSFETEKPHLQLLEILP